MNRVQSFLRLRRQSGYVKAAVVCFLCGILLLIHSVDAVVQYIRQTAEPVEYLLVSGSPYVMSNAGQQNLMRTISLAAVSKQSEVQLITEECSLPCYLLSAQYFLDGYGIHSESVPEAVFVNESAMRLLAGNTAPSHIRIMCQMEERTEMRDIWLADTLPKEEAAAFCVGDSLVLADSDMLRVMRQSQEISGTVEQTLTEMGYSIVNHGKTEELQHAQVLMLVRLWYGLLAAFFTMLSSAVLYRCGVMILSS
ncbi:MAG: hypothetical protein MJ071_03320 [Oscillospiraceae bacterium]|nr:hypothetical protein [Oscillospiraceae bacterium]